MHTVMLSNFIDFTFAGGILCFQPNSLWTPVTHHTMTWKLVSTVPQLCIDADRQYIYIAYVYIIYTYRVDVVGVGACWHRRAMLILEKSTYPNSFKECHVFVLNALHEALLHHIAYYCWMLISLSGVANTSIALYRVVDMYINLLYYLVKLMITM